MFNTIIYIGTTDFEALQPIQLSDSKAIIRLFTSNDMIALEYEDTVTLAFNPSHPNFTQLIEDAGEFIRDNVTVNIIDNDRKYTMSIIFLSIFLLCKHKSAFSDRVTSHLVSLLIV